MIAAGRQPQQAGFLYLLRFPRKKEESSMPHHDLVPSLPFKINENQLAITAVMEVLSNWVELA